MNIYTGLIERMEGDKSSITRKRKNDSSCGSTLALSVIAGQQVTSSLNSVKEVGEGSNQDEKECPRNCVRREIIVVACGRILDIERELVQDLSCLKFGLPVAYVYNPLVYAWGLHEQYVRKYGGRRVEVLLVGMNPGPFGMAQTGVPFGDNIIVRDFLKISGKVDSPSITHPKRQIYGLDCPRREVSGQRLWGWAEKKFHSATQFHSQFWIHNYCPLLFMEASGKNRTPDKLPSSERELLDTCCSKALIATVNLLEPRLVVGVGKYATKRIQACGVKDIVVGEVMHPSPANPKANKEWAHIFETQLKNLGVA